MEPNLNPAQVAAWMRGQAKRFADMATEIEQTFNLNGSRPVLDEMPVSKGLIQDLLSDGRSRRVAQIAEELNLPEVTIIAAIRKSVDITRNERGWFSLVGGENA